MPQSPKKIHVVTRAYLHSWTHEGLLRSVSLRYGPQKLKTPAAVAWEREWWRSGDPALNEACENACSQLESLLPDALAAIEADWPLRTPTRSVLAEPMPCTSCARAHSSDGSPRFEMRRSPNTAIASPISTHLSAGSCICRVTSSAPSDCQAL